MVGFVAASLLVTWVASAYSLADYNKVVTPGLVAPIKGARAMAGSCRACMHFCNNPAYLEAVFAGYGAMSSA